jgi:hypothetical protein
MPYCKNCVNSRWYGSEPRPITRSVCSVLFDSSFGVKDVGGASHVKVAFCKGNSDGCGRPVLSVMAVPEHYSEWQSLTSC